MTILPWFTPRRSAALVMALLVGGCLTTDGNRGQPTIEGNDISLPPGVAMPAKAQVAEMGRQCEALVEDVFLHDRYTPYMIQAGWNEAALAVVVDVVEDDSLQGFEVMRAFLTRVGKVSPGLLEAAPRRTPGFRSSGANQAVAMVFKVEEPTDQHPKLLVECVAKKFDDFWYIHELRFSRKKSDDPVKVRIRATVNPPPVAA